MSSTAMGVLIGILIAAIVLLVSQIKKSRSGNPKEYDERQIAIRGKGYKLGFIVLVAELVVYAFVITADQIAAVIDPAVVVLGMIYFAGIVMVAYNVMHDAYFGIKKNMNQIMLAWIVVAISQAVIFMTSITDGGAFENGRISLRAGLSAVTCGFFLLFFVILGVKKLAERREVDE